MRLFIGIPLPHTVVGELSAISQRLKSGAADFRWTTADSWHITLQFLGNVRDEAFQCLLARLRELRSPAVPIRLDEFDSFARSGAFFAGVVVTPELAALQRCVTETTAPCGFEPEARGYHPHITLARSKREGNAKGLRALKERAGHTPFAPEFLAHEFALYESFLSREGSRYEIRASFPLGSAESRSAPESIGVSG